MVKQSKNNYPSAKLTKAGILLTMALTCMFSCLESPALANTSQDQNMGTNNDYRNSNIKNEQNIFYDGVDYSERFQNNPSRANSTLNPVKYHQPRKELDELLQKLDVLEKDKDIVRFYITGIPGSGKTELAKHYAREYKDKYLFVRVFDAETPETLQTSFELLASKIDAREFSYLKLMYDGKELRDATIQFILENLRGREERFLWIFDSVEDYRQIEDYIFPDTEDIRGTVIITTQERHLDDSITDFDYNDYSIDLNKGMDKKEAVDLLYEIVREKIDEDMLGTKEDALNLVEDLDRLPLAISASAFYIRKKNESRNKRHNSIMTFNEYIELFNDEIERVKLENDGAKYRNETSIFKYKLTQGVAIRLLIEQLSKEELAILKLCGFINAKHIPRWLLEEYLKFELPDAKQFSEEDIGELVDDHPLLSLESNGEEDSDDLFFIHRETQFQAKRFFEKEKHDIFHNNIVVAIRKIFDDSLDNEQIIALLPHLKSLLEHNKVIKDNVSIFAVLIDLVSGGERFYRKYLGYNIPLRGNEVLPNLLQVISVNLRIACNYCAVIPSKREDAIKFCSESINGMFPYFSMLAPYFAQGDERKLIPIEAIKNMGYVYAKEGKFSDAERYYNLALSKFPELPEVFKDIRYFCIKEEDPFRGWPFRVHYESGTLTVKFLIAKSELHTDLAILYSLTPSFPSQVPYVEEALSNIEDALEIVNADKCFYDPSDRCIRHAAWCRIAYGQILNRIGCFLDAKNEFYKAKELSALSKDNTILESIIDFGIVESDFKNVTRSHLNLGNYDPACIKEMADQLIRDDGFSMLLSTSFNDRDKMSKEYEDYAKQCNEIGTLGGSRLNSEYYIFINAQNCCKAANIAYKLNDMDSYSKHSKSFLDFISSELSVFNLGSEYFFVRPVVLDIRSEQKQQDEGSIRYIRHCFNVFSLMFGK